MWADGVSASVIITIAGVPRLAGKRSRVAEDWQTRRSRQRRRERVQLASLARSIACFTRPRGIRTSNLRFRGPMGGNDKCADRQELKESGEPCCTECCTNGAQVDTELVAVVEAWPTLPGAVKVGILAMIRARS